MCLTLKDGMMWREDMVRQAQPRSAYCLKMLFSVRASVAGTSDPAP